eukprot:evm.model.NODE_30760_length_8410_cov_12.739001.1
MALITARLVFLLSVLVSFDPEYVLVLLSYVSVMLQAICLEHLRSSAPREKRIFLAGALNRVDASTRLLDCHHQHASSDDAAVCAGGSRAGRRSGRGEGEVGGGGGWAGELYDGHQQDMDLIATITAKMKVDVEEGRDEGREKSPHRFLIPSWVHLPLSLHFSSQLPPSLPPSPLSPQQRTKAYWTGKTEALRVLWHDLSRPNKEEEGLSPFNLLLRLLTYEDVLGELDEAFVREPASIEFYIPQLVTFLLYGAFWSSGQLLGWLGDQPGGTAAGVGVD